MILFLFYVQVPLIMKPKLKNPSGESLTSANGGVEETRVTLAWQDLSVYVPVKGTGIIPSHPRHRPFKRVLNNGKHASLFDA
jgi:hypothetical protein